MRTLFILNIILLCNNAHGQLESSSSVIFNDTVASNRKVIGVKSTMAGTDGVSVGNTTSGQLIYAIASGNNATSLNLPLNYVLTEGSVIHYKAAGMNTSVVTLSVNGSIAFAVNKKVNVPLDSAEIQSGQIVSVIFDGLAFQVISKLYRPCKSGFVSVNNEYCIDTASRGPASFYGAVIACGNDDAMLCTWPQWYMACTDSLSNGSSGYLTNFEWINDAGNNSADAKVVGFNNASLYNGYGCKKSYSLPPTLTSFSAPVETSGNTIDIRFRCCYKK